MDDERVQVGQAARNVPAGLQHLQQLHAALVGVVDALAQIATLGKLHDQGHLGLLGVCVGTLGAGGGGQPGGRGVLEGRGGGRGRWRQGQVVRGQGQRARGLRVQA